MYQVFCNTAITERKKDRKEGRILHALLSASAVFSKFCNYKTSTNTLVFGAWVGQETIKNIKFHTQASVHEGYVQKDYKQQSHQYHV